MKLVVLDTKAIASRNWLLGKGNLFEYLNDLKEEFYTYSIQRKIVKNRYLDSIVKTVTNGDPIPLITLTYTEKKIKFQVGKTIDVNMGKVEILDGLQRTFRLWMYYKLIEEFEKRSITSAAEFAKNIKERYPFIFETGIISFSTIRELVETNGLLEIKNAFKKFDLYFIVWSNLSKKEVIHKMLVLNAGQRSVSKTHQYELLFLSLWEDLEGRLKGIRLFREKETTAGEIKSGRRDIGDYIFSSIIVGLRSFLGGKPLKVSGDLDVVGTAFEDDYRDINEDVFNVEFIRTFLNYIKEIDKAVFKKEGDEGKKWFVRETTIVGILAGLGEYLEMSEELSIKEINARTKTGFDLLLKKSTAPGFKLTQFRDQYNILYNRSVNVGTFVRRVIKNYTVELLQGKSPSWATFFNEIKK
jgi:hypothetical protein